MAARETGDADSSCRGVQSCERSRRALARMRQPKESADVRCLEQVAAGCQRNPASRAARGYLYAVGDIGVAERPVIGLIESNRPGSGITRPPLDPALLKPGTGNKDHIPGLVIADRVKMRRCRPGY